MGADMTADTRIKRRLLPMMLPSLAVLMIGLRFAVERTGVPHFAGWALVVGSLLILIGYIAFFLRGR